MIIKHPTDAEKAGLSALWQEAFSEPEEAFETFYATGFSPDRSMVCLEKDSVVAALYWFDCLWNDKKVAYLYAVATKKSHRGQGLCHQLMAATHAELKEKGYFGAILVPAENSLFPFYEKMGYLPCGPGAIPAEKIPCHSSLPCHSERSEESVTPNSPLSTLHSPLTLTPISLEEYLTLQKDLLPKDAVTHTATAYEYLKHFGEFYKTETGILCKIEEDIQERLPHTPEGEMASMYLPLTKDNHLPTYFAHPLA